MPDRVEELNQVMTRVDGVAPGSGLEKHRKMAVSPFVMLRGASSVFYRDLAHSKVELPHGINQWPQAMIMGDCHISNFGFFSEEGSHGEEVIFAPNDFDDACVGFAGWDLLRFGVSLILTADHCQGVLAGRYVPLEPLSKSKVVDDAAVQNALLSFIHGYRSACEKLVEKTWDYSHVLNGFDNEHILFKPEQKAIKRMDSGEDFLTKSSLAKAVDLTVDLSEQSPRFRDISDRFSRIEGAEYRELEKAFAPYVDDSILDIVVRLGAGTGSVNMTRYYLLVGPNPLLSKAEISLCHIVEVKKQRAAAPLYEFHDLSPINQLNPAHLTVNCQRRMQRNPDLVLDDVMWKKAPWLVRSRHHARVGIDPEDIACGKRAEKGGFADYAEACGVVLALAHARSDRRSNQFEKAVVETSSEAWSGLIQSQRDYAKQVTSDWEWLRSVELN
ncbi:DUF2252 family protein [Marinomonas balearica]|uniref:Uncharacterized protein DUF2252 n=1 Tax=Marinomonas balearica TaxID=491947 RepID=A0A4R6M4V5_9GAMM|nr:DUF2252 family protein [Marinomonas balearica]TDO95765.1 uncharacterized protein DUF2252 [Marinomonas balearica]